MALGKYEKIVVLSTLAEPKSLVDISITWFGNKGRLYQDPIRKEIENSIRKGNLIRIGKTKIKANTLFFIEQTLRNLNLKDKVSKEYTEWLRYFYTNLGQYTQKVYLNFEIIKALVSENGRLNYHKGNDIDLGLLLQLPFLLQHLEKKQATMTNLHIQLLSLDKYTRAIEKLELQYAYILKEQRRLDDWSRALDKLAGLLPKRQKGINIFRKWTL